MPADAAGPARPHRGGTATEAKLQPRDHSFVGGDHRFKRLGLVEGGQALFPHQLRAEMPEKDIRAQSVASLGDQLRCSVTAQ